MIQTAEIIDFRFARGVFKLRQRRRFKEDHIMVAKAKKKKSAGNSGAGEVVQMDQSPEKRFGAKLSKDQEVFTVKDIARVLGLTGQEMKVRSRMRKFDIRSEGGGKHKFNRAQALEVLGKIA